MNSRTLRSDAPAVGVILSEVDYARLFHSLPEPYLLFEASEPYRILDTNKARDDMVGVPRRDCVGHPLFEVYPYTNERFSGTVGKNLHARLEQLVRAGRSQQLEPISYPRTAPDGTKQTVYMQTTYFPLRDTTGAVRYILAATREVTDELHAAERAAAAEGRLRAALTIGKVGSWVCDVATGRITCDENLIKLFKMSGTYAENYTLDMFLKSVYVDDKARVASAIRRSMKRPTLFEIECRIVIADGTRRWILARGEPEPREEGLVFSGVVVDLTEQRNLQAQVALARQQDRLNRRAARMLQQRNEELEAVGRSKDEFVALASHQLRTPATAVKQYVGMVLQGYVGDVTDEQVNVLTKAFESNERQLQIINQILSAARVDTGRLTMMPMPSDLRALAQSIITDMESSLQQREHTLTVKLPIRPVQVAADVGYLRMAIENVVHNASIYTPKGGRIAVQLTQHGPTCTLSISDSGVGIKKADLGKLFVKFSRIHNPLSVEAGGSGIGLYLTAEIIRLHGGSIDVVSRPGKGTTFAISLPIAQTDKDSASEGAEE